MICTWGYRKDFDLIPAKTGIPAWLVILEIHLFAVMSLHSAISVLLARKEATFLGISFGGMSFLAAPGTLGGPRGEEIAQGYPNIFGLTTLILCFLIWAFFFERKKAKEAA